MKTFVKLFTLSFGICGMLGCKPSPPPSSTPETTDSQPSQSQESELAPSEKEATMPGTPASDITILLSPNATPAEIYAADELALYVGKMLGRDLTPQKSESIPAQGLNFIIGRHPASKSLPLNELKEEESLTHIEGQTIHLVGGRSEKTITNKAGDAIPLHDRGTLFAVYDFLESQGVRWYRPEAWGEHVPQLPALKLEQGTQRVNPVYRYRYGISHYSTFGSSEEWLPRHHMTKIWALRNRQNTNIWRENTQPGEDVSRYGGDYRIDFSHAYFRFIPQERYFATHPEYFALINGVRSSDRYAQLCLGNKEVQELTFQFLKKEVERRPNQTIFAVDPNDLTMWCECPLCTAMDEPKQKAATGRGAGGVSMSNRVARFNNIIAKRLAEVRPGVGVGYYAYSQHTAVPDFPLEPNIYIQAAAFGGAYSDYSRKLYDEKSAPNRRFRAVLDGYKGKVNLMGREYWSFYRWVGPLPIVHTMTDRMRVYHQDYGMTGIYSETHPCWGPQGMILYFYPWLLRNPYADVEAEKELYYRNFYGPAYEPMKAYHEYLEKIGQEGTYYCSGGAYADQLFTPKNIGQLRKWINEATQLIGDSEPYASRMKGVEAGHIYSEMTVRFQELRKANRLLEAKKKLDEMEAYLLSFPDGSVFDNASGKPPRDNWIVKAALNQERDLLGGANRLLALFDDPKIALDLSSTWRFSPAQEDSLPERWFAPEFSENGWARLNAGKPWQQQGFEDHHGVGLYRKVIKTPSIKAGNRFILYFAQIDGHAVAYLDGKEVGKRDLGPEYEGYKEGWYIDLTDLLTPNTSHQLAVKVSKDVWVGGLTQPVYLLEVASIRPPEE